LVNGFGNQLDFIAAIITVIACIALFKLNQSVLRVIGVSAILGLIIKLIL
jgi:chromate transporter